MAQEYSLNKSKINWSYFAKNFTSVTCFLFHFCSAPFSKLNSLHIFAASVSANKLYCEIFKVRCDEIQQRKKIGDGEEQKMGEDVEVQRLLGDKYLVTYAIQEDQSKYYLW